MLVADRIRKQSNRGQNGNGQHEVLETNGNNMNAITQSESGELDMMIVSRFGKSLKKR